MEKIIFNIFFAILSNYINITIIKNITNKKLNLNLMFLYSILIGIVSTLIQTYMITLNSFEMVISVILSITLLKLLFNIKFINGIILNVLSLCILSIVDVFWVLIIQLFGFNTKILQNEIIPYTLIYSIMYISIILIFKIKKVKNIFNNLYEVINNLKKIEYRKSISIILYVIIILIFITINAFIYKIVPSPTNFYVALSNIIIYIICFIINFFLLNLFKNYHKTSNEYNELKLYTGIMEYFLTESKKFRHDYKNMLITMEEYIHNNDIEGLKEYFYNGLLESSTHLYNDKNISILHNIKDIGIKGLIATKIYYAESLNIKANISIPEMVEKINIKTYDFCRIIGILLDNAIEATKECTDKYMDMIMVVNSECVTFTLANTFINKDISIEDMFKKGFSSKKNGHGFGLSNIKEITEKYDNVLLNTFIKNDLFIQEINIYN